MERPLKPVIMSHSGSYSPEPDYSKIENDKPTPTIISMSPEYPKYRDALIIGGVILLLAVFVGGLYLTARHKDWSIRKLVGGNWSSLYAGFHNNRGLTYYNKGQYEKAISAFTKAIEIDPKNAEVFHSRGTAYNYRGQYDLALLDFSKALEISPADAFVYNDRGVVYALTGQHDRAIADFSKAIEINPKDAEAYYNRGFAYGEKGEYDKAISDYTKAIEINPKDAEAYDNRGLAYYRKGDYDKACSDWNRACELGSCKNYELVKRKGDCK